MGLVNLKANEVIHKKGDKVETIEIVVKGKVCITVDDSSITVEVGAILGCCEVPGKEYCYNYKALEDSAVFSVV